MKIYLDNAATTFPKPESVYDSMNDFMRGIGSSPGRGSYSSALESSRLVYSCRESICDLFNFDKPENVIFTSNITNSLNILLQGIVKEGWHIITSSMEHNSVLRPLYNLKEKLSIELDIINCSENGLLDIEEFKSKIKSNTKLVVLSHASNIIGSIQPLEAIGDICKENNMYFIIDSAQTAGVIPIDFKKLNCSALAFTGHKSLLGPQGIGGFIISDELNEVCTSLVLGGTGSLSSSILQPDFLPDKFESGTLNTPGIVGLMAGINYIKSIGIEDISSRESELCGLFLDSLINMDSVKVYGLKDPKLRTATISVNFNHRDSSEISYLLDSEYGIMTRTGLHCAPLAHKTIGTYPEGALRFSIGPFNDIKDINYTIHSLHKILKGD